MRCFIHRKVQELFLSHLQTGTSVPTRVADLMDDLCEVAFEEGVEQLDLKQQTDELWTRQEKQSHTQV